MEVVLKNVNYRYKAKKLLDKIDLKIKNERITGITGDNKTLLIEMIDSLTFPDYGEIKIGGEVIDRNNLTKMRKKVCLIRQRSKDQFFTDTPREEMMFLIGRLDYKNKNIIKKMEDALKLVGLSEDYLIEKINALSAGEQKLIQIAINLIYNPNIIIFDEPFVELDYANRKKLKNLIKLLKDRYHKTIIIASNDNNLLYELTDDLIIIKKTRVIAADETTKIYQDVDFLIHNGIDIPDLVHFTYLAKKKNIKLSYHRDVRDLIKDVYKHV